MDVTKRAASMNDSNLLLEWRNSPTAIDASQTSHIITISEHEEWLKRRVEKLPHEPFWIFSVAGAPVGYVRLELQQNAFKSFTISLFVDEAFQGRGMGEIILKTSILELVSRYDYVVFWATIKESNFRSVNLFQRLGFKFFRKVDEIFSEFRLTSTELTFRANNI
jgi:RimJ/RimL family protein N-acetyltransferase